MSKTEVRSYKKEAKKLLSDLREYEGFIKDNLIVIYIERELQLAHLKGSVEALETLKKWYE